MHAAKRPVFLNLLRIHLPVAGVMSIAHRVSGVALFLALPCASWLLATSLSGPSGWRSIQRLFESWPGRVLLIIALWALLHHLFAGVRYLLLDLDIGIQRPRYRYSAWAVLVCAPLAALALGLAL